MSKPPFDEVLTSLRMPVRDVAKTLRAASHASESRLSGPADMLPGPVRDLIKQSVVQADELGSKLFDRGPPSAAAIKLARGILASGSRGVEGQPTFVRVLSRAIGAGLKRQGQEDWVVSQVRLAMIVTEQKFGAADLGDQALRSAALMRAIFDSHAVFTVKDFVPSKVPELVDASMIATFAALLWLCVDVDVDDQQDEAVLLELCLDVTLASRDDVQSALASREGVTSHEALTGLFERLAGVV